MNQRGDMVRRKAVRWNVVRMETSMLVLLIVGLKCTLAASHADPGEAWCVYRRDKQTDGRQTVRDQYPGAQGVSGRNRAIIF